MKKRHGFASLMLLTLALGMAWGQDRFAQPEDGASQPVAPVTAFEQNNPTAPVTENPPISAIDQPGLLPHAAPLSYVQAGAHITESADSNVANVVGGTGYHSVTRALGSLELQRLWRNYDLALVYVGGVGYYDVAGIGFKQLQQLDVDQRIKWKRGQLAVRDSFSYLPEGNFAGGYGSLGASGQALGEFGGSGFFGGSVLGGIGQVPRIMNLSLVDVTENLTPKSSVTASGGYSFVHYTGDHPGVVNIPFFGSTEVSAQAGYDRIVGHHDQVALTYGYQGFRFTNPSSTSSQTDTSFHTHVVQLMWDHRISGRTDFLVSAGPQFTRLNLYALPSSGTAVNFPPCVLVVQEGVVECPIEDVRVTVAGRATLRYRFPKTYVDLAYERFTSSGSGIFPGANSNVVRVSMNRPLTRVWSIFSDAGYAHNSRIQALSAAQEALCQLTSMNCPNVTANTYSYGFAGLGVHRRLGHDFRVYGSYGFTYFTLDRSACGLPGSPPCKRNSQRQIVSIGVDWTPRPVRLD